MSLLFVDDEQPIRDLFERALNSAGFEFDGAADGNQAIIKLELRRYDAVVIDIIMPDREGVETIVEIRRRWPETYIVAISGGGRIGGNGFLNMAKALGADRTLTKPFTPAKLLATLSECRPPQLAA
jgi:DNA-binding response OmpR family regulator